MGSKGKQTKKKKTAVPKKIKKQTIEKATGKKKKK